MNYDLLRGLHILAVIAWMAGLLYLPRLFAYHTKAAAGSEMDTTFQTMEVKLYRIIMNPAMIAAWLFGLSLIWIRTSGMCSCRRASDWSACRRASHSATGPSPATAVRQGMVLMRSPTIDSTPSSSSLRPEVVTPYTTSASPL